MKRSTNCSKRWILVVERSIIQVCFRLGVLWGLCEGISNANTHSPRNRSRPHNPCQLKLFFKVSIRFAQRWLSSLLPFSRLHPVLDFCILSLDFFFTGIRLGGDGV